MATVMSGRKATGTLLDAGGPVEDDETARQKMRGVEVCEKGVMESGAKMLDSTPTMSRMSRAMHITLGLRAIMTYSSPWSTSLGGTTYRWCGGCTSMVPITGM